MPTRRSPRYGSLQYWPRKRANRFLPSVNWQAINSDKTLKGFICYKAGMASAYVKDSTPTSMTKGKNIIVPITILECPKIRIFSVRFYKYGRVAKEVLAENLDKELKRKIKFPKTHKKVDEVKDGEYDDIRVIIYSQVKKTNIKKTPDMIEIGMSGSLENKLNFVKENMNKEISASEFFSKGQLVDLRGLTKGKGLQGPVRRIGIGLKSHKSEKGRRRPGNLGPWHPARVTMFSHQAGQLGMFTRVLYNNKIIDMGKAGEKKFENLKNFGSVKTDYILVSGSVQGPAKRQLIMTQPLRQTRKQVKKSYELIELR
jgi:large subunit ribosomal protein L3